MSKRLDITDQQFGRLVAKKPIYVNGKPKWECLCSCGNLKITGISELRGGSTRSCGCLRVQINRNLRLIHGDTSFGNMSTEYRSWSGMIQRCECERNKRYSRYGGRGISVCTRWRNSFSNFLSDMGRKPGPEYSLDRINNDGNYEPENCRWATLSQQAMNRKRPSKKRYYANKSCSSEYLGVHWNKFRNRWEASGYICRKRKYLGRSEDEYEAHLMVDKFLSAQGVKNAR